MEHFIITFRVAGFHQLWPWRLGGRKAASPPLRLFVSCPHADTVVAYMTANSTSVPTAYLTAPVAVTLDLAPKPAGRVRQPRRSGALLRHRHGRECYHGLRMFFPLPTYDP